MAAADSPDDESPQPTAHARDRLPNNPIARRSFMRRTAVTGAALVAASSGVVADEDDDDGDTMEFTEAQMYDLSGVNAILSGFSSVVGSVFGSDDTEELHARIYADAMEIQERRSTQFNSINENITMLREFVRTNAAHTIGDRVDAGDSTDEVLSAAEDRLAEDVANIEGELFAGWTIDYNAAIRRIYQASQSESADWALSNMFYRSYKNVDGISSDFLINAEASQGANSIDPAETWMYAHEEDYETLEEESRFGQFQVERVDGESVQLKVMYNASGSDPMTLLVPFDGRAYADDTGDYYADQHSEYSYELIADADERSAAWDDDADLQDDYSKEDFEQAEADMRLRTYPVDSDGSSIAADMLDAGEYVKIHHEIRNLYEEEMDNLQTLVQTIEDGIEDGTIDVEDIASGQAILDAAGDWEDWQDAAGYYRAISFPEADEPAVVEMSDGVELEGKLFWTMPVEDGEDATLPVGETINPAEESGEIHMAAEVTHVPDGHGVTTHDVTVTVEQTDGEAAELADVTIGDREVTTNEFGEAEFEGVEEGTQTIEVHYENETTIVSRVVVSGSTEFTVEATGEDHVGDQDDEEDDDGLEGEILAFELTEEFEIVGLPDSDGPLEFESRTLIDPDDPEAINARLQEAYEDEIETLEGDTEVNVEVTNPIGAGGIFDGLGDNIGYFGLGLIGLTILAVIGIVKDLIPGLGD